VIVSRKAQLASLAAILIAAGTIVQAASASASAADDHAQETLRQMTLQEKLALLRGSARLSQRLIKP
jgi:hypothetical protein